MSPHDLKILLSLSMMGHFFSLLSLLLSSTVKSLIFTLILVYLFSFRTFLLLYLHYFSLSPFLFIFLVSLPSSFHFFIYLSLSVSFFFFFVPINLFLPLYVSVFLYLIPLSFFKDCMLNTITLITDKGNIYIETKEGGDGWSTIFHLEGHKEDTKRETYKKF